MAVQTIHGSQYRYAECHYAECHYAECHYAECHYAECLYAVIMLSVVMLSVIMQSVIMLSVVAPRHYVNKFSNLFCKNSAVICLPSLSRQSYNQFYKTF